MIYRIYLYNELNCNLSKLPNFSYSFKHICCLSSSSGFSFMMRCLPYRSVEDIDLYPAAMSEPPLGNGILGPTFACLIGQHFHDLKVGDRYWHENLDQPRPFTNGECFMVTYVIQLLYCSSKALNVLTYCAF